MADNADPIAPPVMLIFKDEDGNTSAPIRASSVPDIGDSIRVSYLRFDVAGSVISREWSISAEYGLATTTVYVTVKSAKDY